MSENELEQAIALLCDLVDRWPDERGYDGAIQRARLFVLEHRLRWPTREQVRAGLDRPKVRLNPG
jgi:hypothetical protein